VASVLVTGGSGFLGSLLVQRLLAEGHFVVNVDLVPCPLVHQRLKSIVGDIRNRFLLDSELSCEIAAVFHCAALLAHGSISKAELWSSNVQGTETLAAAVKASGIPFVVYTSSNCLWGREFDRPVQEDDAPEPVELYGQTKWEGEKILLRYKQDFRTAIIRCPTIIDEGRLGLLSILFEFIQENRKVWVVGDGSNRYQFIYAQDLINAMLLAWHYQKAGTFAVGADDVRSLKAIYEYVIQQARSRSRVALMPRWPAITAMRIAHLLRVSPLGPYHYRMIASNFSFDTTRTKAELNWRPSLSNHEMLLKSYLYFKENMAEIRGRNAASSHRKPASMGIIRILKWLS